MIKQVRFRLFLVTSALLGLIAIGGLIALAWIVGGMLRRDLRELVTTARANPGASVDPDAADDVDDWVHDIAADAERNLSAFGRERALLTAVLESMSNGVIALDAASKIVVMNAAARGLLGLTSTPIGEPLIDVVRAPALIELIQASGSATAELQLRADTRVIARITAPPERGPRVVVLEDVTTVRKLETIRRDFVANMSHELRTPVTIIRANAETLIGGAAADPTIAPRLLDGLHRNAERLALLLADLLDLSRLDAGQFRFDRVELPIEPACATARAAVESAATEREATIRLEIEPGLVAQADPKALDQALVNLVDNAVKYGAKGGTVWIRGRRAGDRVRIEVSDDGPGIAPKHRDRIFERFYRADSGRTRDAGGTGLGLAIVKHLVESMAGAVGVEANLPTGTRFWIDLPAAPAEVA